MIDRLDGEAAVLQVITTLAGRFLKRPHNPWCLWLERSGAVPGTASARGMRDLARARTVVHELAHDVRAGANLSLVPEVVRVYEADDGSLVEQRGCLALGLRMDLAQLYAPRGPLHTDLEHAPAGVHIPLHVGHWKRARSFALEHLEGACFAPTLVIQRGWHLDLFFLLERAVEVTRETQAALAELTRSLSGLVLGSRAMRLGHPIPLTGLIDTERRAGCPTRLVVARLDRRLSLSALRAAASGLRQLQVQLASIPSSGGGGSLSPAMSLGTLPPNWTLEDWNLADRHKQLIAAGSDHAGAMLFTALPEIVAECARRRHGWLDVEALIDDPRFGLVSALHFRGTTRRGLKLAFARAVAEIDARYPPRLPFGVRYLVPIEPSQPGERRRYVLAGRPGDGQFRVEVPWDLLASPVRMRRALEAEFEALLAPIPPKTWEVMLQVGLTDPRCRRLPSARQSKSLSDRIATFVRRAEPYLPPIEGLTSSDPSGWPLIREGVAVFPRGVLLAHLANEGGGQRIVGRKELTEAIAALGGGPRGVMHFAGSGKIRVWFCPMKYSTADSRRTSTRDV